MKLSELFKRRKTEAVKTDFERYRELLFKIDPSGDLEPDDREELFSIVGRLGIDPATIESDATVLHDHAEARKAAADVEKIKSDRQVYEAESKAHNREYARALEPLNRRGDELNARARQLDGRMAAANHGRIWAEQLESEHYRLFNGEDLPEPTAIDADAGYHNRAHIEASDQVTAEKYAALLSAGVFDAVVITVAEVESIERAAAAGKCAPIVAENARKLITSRQQQAQSDKAAADELARARGIAQLG